MKRKLFIVVNVLIVATTFFTACSKTQNHDDMTKIVFYLEGGTFQNSERPVTYYYPFEKGTENLIKEPTSLSDEKITRNGYVLEGWYREKSEDDGKTVYSGKWNFETDRVSDEGITLYACWKKNVEYTYNVCYTDAKTGEKEILGSYSVKAGDKFDDFLNYSSKRYGYTALGTYSDSEGNPWDENFAHPGGEESLAVDVYPDYIEGEYAIVRTVTDLRAATKSNIYLMNDIDFSEEDDKTLSFADYRNKTFEGNGYTVKNFVVKYTVGRYIDLPYDIEDDSKKSLYISLFGNTYNSCIRNVTFEGVKLDVDVGVSLTNIYRIYVAPVSVLAEKTTVENVRFELEYTVSRLPSEISEENGRLVVFGEVCGNADSESSVTNSSASVRKSTNTAE